MNEGVDPDQLFTAAVALHEMQLSLIRAGFTESQALYLVGQQFRGLASPGPPETEP